MQTTDFYTLSFSADNNVDPDIGEKGGLLIRVLRVLRHCLAYVPYLNVPKVRVGLQNYSSYPYAPL